MRLIIVTFILAAISVYVYIDYDNLKERFFPDDNSNTVQVAERLNPEPVVDLSLNQQSEPETRFHEGDVVYINSMIADEATFEANEAPLWRTYHGSEHDEFQDIKEHVPHRLEVKIILLAIGEGGKSWYKIRTASGFPIEGWIEEKYLSRELPKRRKGLTTDWGA